MKKILIVCVNYNSYEALYSFLESVDHAAERAKALILVDVAIVDNSTKPQKIATTNYPDIHIDTYDTNMNLGYLGGAQYIINNIENKSQYDYIAISNVDLKMSDDFIEKLSQYNCSADIGWVAPSVFSLKEHRDKKTLYRPSKRKFKFLCLLFKYPILYKLYRASLYTRRRESTDLTKPSIIYSGHGAFFLLTKEFFKRNPRLEYKPFLFCEENYVAELLRENSLKCKYEPQLKIWDEEHVSTGKMNYKKMCKYNYEAHQFIYNRFY